MSKSPKNHFSDPVFWLGVSFGMVINVIIILIFSPLNN